MKTQIKLAALALLLSTINPQLSTCFAQGLLTPPGAPAPAMKSLDRIEGMKISALPCPHTVAAFGGLPDWDFELKSR